jgi:hypothetical protein
MHKENSSLVSIRFASFDVFMAELPQEVLTNLNDKSAEIQTSWNANNFGEKLAGRIKKQYVLENVEYLNNFVLSLSETYCYHLNEIGKLQYYTTNGFKLKCGTPWINFQAPTEYNPLHNHSGLFSWVIWLKIPFERKKEQEHFPNINQQSVLNGCFEFVYPSVTGGVSTHIMDLDTSYEGRIIIFPSTMKHQVYPFYTTDDYRISISGNVYIDTD